jgi:type I restriction enzyme S subunit
MQSYVEIPSQLSVQEVRAKDSSWSPGMFRRVMIPTGSVKPVRALLDPKRPFDRGIEPGSLWYLYRSTHCLIRTKALQPHSCLLYPKGDAIVPINPRVFENVGLSNDDILLSKDSNVGECAMVNGDDWRNYMFSGGIVRLNPTVNRFYFFAFLKHPIFKSQLLAMTPRGATITHAKTLWLDCRIPFPSQPNADDVVIYVSALMQAIVDKEIAIRERHGRIFALIEAELMNQQPRKFARISSRPLTKSEQLAASTRACIAAAFASLSIASTIIALVRRHFRALASARDAGRILRFL